MLVPDSQKKIYEVHFCWVVLVGARGRRLYQKIINPSKMLAVVRKMNRTLVVSSSTLGALQLYFQKTSQNQKSSMLFKRFRRYTKTYHYTFFISFTKKSDTLTIIMVTGYVLNGTIIRFIYTLSLISSNLFVVSKYSQQKIHNQPDRDSSRCIWPACLLR